MAGWAKRFSVVKFAFIPGAQWGERERAMSMYIQNDEIACVHETNSAYMHGINCRWQYCCIKKYRDNNKARGVEEGWLPSKTLWIECDTRNVVPDKWNRFNLLKTCKVSYWYFISVNCIIYFHGNGSFVIWVYNESI